MRAAEKRPSGAHLKLASSWCLTKRGLKGMKAAEERPSSARPPEAGQQRAQRGVDGQPAVPLHVDVGVHDLHA